MQLTAADASSLPLIAALLDDGEVVAATPEWSGDLEHAARYRVGRFTLAVGDDAPDSGVEVVAGRLLGALHEMLDRTDGPARHRSRMLASGMALVARRVTLRPSTTGELVEALEASLSETWPELLHIAPHRERPLPDPHIVALALLQIIRNAGVHDKAQRVRLDVDDGPSFVLTWTGTAVPGGIRPARHQALRERWGLGYVRLAADAVGAVFLSPHRVGPRQLEAEFAIEAAPRLSLPLAAVGRDLVVEQASEGWREETGITEASRLPDPIARLASAALEAPGTVLAAGTYRARAGPRRTWLAIPPQGSRDCAADVLRALVHERDLLAAPEPYRTTVRGLSWTLKAMLGEGFPPWSVADFGRDFPMACAALGVDAAGASVATSATCAPEPFLAAYLMASLGGHLDVGSNTAVLHLPEVSRDDPIALALADEAGDIPLI